MSVAPLDQARVNDLLSAHPGWALEEGGKRIVRECRFTDFSEAFAFMTRVAMLAEVMDHHPEWSNVYNRVTIALTTHDADGLSDRDARMATAIDAMLTI